MSTPIAEDYFSKGVNLFPEGPTTDKHLGQLIREIQQIIGRAGFQETVFAVGANGTQPDIPSALALIEDAAVDKPYVILLGPEEYVGDVTLKPYVYVIGQGRGISRITGRVIGPVSGDAGLFSCSVSANDAVPALDCAAGVFRVLDVDVRNDSADENARSIRVTGGELFFRGRSLLGPIEVTNGRAVFQNAELVDLQGSRMSAGRILFEGEMRANFAGRVWDLTGGVFEIRSAFIENPLGGFFRINGATLTFGTLFQRAMGVGVPPVDAVQRITFDQVPDAGQLFLQYNTEVTNALEFNEGASELESLLNSLPSLDNVQVAGSYAAGFDITFTGVDGQKPQPLLVVNANTLENTSTPVVVTIVETTPGVEPAGHTIEMQTAGNVLAGLNNIPASNKLITGGTVDNAVVGL